MTQFGLNYIVISVIFSCLLFACVGAHVQSRDEKDVCLEKYKVSALPHKAKKAIRNYYQIRLSMADAGEKFQATDVVSGRRLKERRLIFWTICDGLVYLVYEHGGYGYHRHLIVLTIQDNSYKIVKNVGIGKAKTLMEMKEILQGDRDSIEHF